MKIYSIKEIVEATNNILNSDTPIKPKDQIKEKKIEDENEASVTPLVLNNDISLISKKEIDFTDQKFELKPEIKEKIIEEIYDFLKKKVKKNTLKVIIDEQIEIKNLKNKINFLNINKNKLIDDYKSLEKRYNFLLENIDVLKVENQKIVKDNNQLKSNNNVLSHSLNKVNIENKNLIVENTELNNNNKELQINLSKISGENSQLYNEIKEFKSELKNKDLYLESINQKNRSFEINNAELKNTISRFIENNKKLQEKLNVLEQSNQTDIKEKNNKIKFYQDENVRLSSELLSAQKSTENIRLNLSDIAMEKQMISNKIKELNKSIEEKTNVISTKFNKEKPDINQENLENLNDIEQKSLDEVVKRIFQKL